MPNEKYQNYRRAKRNGNRSGVSRSSNRLSEFDRDGDWTGGRGLGSASASIGQQGENLEVQPMDTESTERRNVTSDRGGNLPGGRAGIEGNKPRGVNARNLDGFGNNFENEALFPRGTDFIITKVTVDENGHPYIYIEEAQANAERNEPNHDTQKRGGTVRDVQETHSVHGDVQGASEGYSAGNQNRESNLQGTREEVTEETSEAANKEVPSDGAEEVQR